MRRWLERVGGHNDWRLTHEVRIERDGILTDWEWWELPGAGMSGAAVITVGDAGVLLEQITYFENRGRRVS